MDIDLDANATTAVWPPACEAARRAMALEWGNPSSTHHAGRRARDEIEAARSHARQALGVRDGLCLFVSGATEAIQTAVVSALNAWRARRDAGEAVPRLLLYGATEHKAVPEALRHWNHLLGLHASVQPIPVGRDGRHDLAWLRDHAPQAAVVCTMAVNNETGVVSDLAGIAAALAHCSALWLVDGVQALGKLPLNLHELAIDYAAFSGHKLHAPKGVGLLYVRAGAPLTPLMAGGGQEDGHRAGTENVAGIAAFGAVLQALNAGRLCRDRATLQRYRQCLLLALTQAFPGLEVNAPLEACLPTTLNVSVPALEAGRLLEAFDAAGLRASGGSACSASRGEPSPVLAAMGLPEAQCRGAVRLSFAATADEAFIDAACARLHECGEALRQHGLLPGGAPAPAADGLTRLHADGACGYVLVDGASQQAVAVDPHRAGAEAMRSWARRHRVQWRAVLFTQAPPQGEPHTPEDWLDLGIENPPGPHPADAVGPQAWTLGRWTIECLRAPALEAGHQVFLVRSAEGHTWTLSGERPLAGVSSRSGTAGRSLCLPSLDPARRHALRAGEPTAAGVAADTGLEAAAWHGLQAVQPRLRLVDVREEHEQQLDPLTRRVGSKVVESVPLARLVSALPRWLARSPDDTLVFVCRSGTRAAEAALALRRLGHASAWSLRIGLLPDPVEAEPAPMAPEVAMA